MNIAIFCREGFGPPWNEGYKNMTRNLIRFLKSKGDNPIIISNEDIEKYRKLPATIYKLPLIRMLETLFIMRRITRQKQIHLFFQFTGARLRFAIPFYLYEKFLNIPFSAYITSDYNGRFGRKLMNFIMNPNTFFVGGDFLKEQFPKAHLIYPLVDLNGYSHNNNQSAKINTTKVILFLGAFHKQRGVQYLIKAMAQIKDKFDVKLLLAWNGVGEYVTEILGLIREYDLENITEIRGNSDISNLYNEAYLIVIPRIYKKGLPQNMFFPLRIIEALAFQKPMIVSDMYGWGSIIKGCGLAVKPGNVEELRDAIIKMITDKDFHDSCTKECLSKLKKYHPDRSFSKIYEVFQTANKGDRRKGKGIKNTTSFI